MILSVGKADFIFSEGADTGDGVGIGFGATGGIN